MSYGTPESTSWMLGEEEGVKMIKAAYVCHLHPSGMYYQSSAPTRYDGGINAFDTANVRFCAV